jgi:hypothetical protein
VKIFFSSFIWKGKWFIEKQKMEKKEKGKGNANTIENINMRYYWFTF